jgi:hypothetical protein
MLAVKTSARRAAIVRDVKGPTPFRQFVDAVHALSAEPHPENLARYLTASRALEETRRAQRKAAPRRSRTRVASPQRPKTH